MRAASEGEHVMDAHAQVGLHEPKDALDIARARAGALANALSHRRGDVLADLRDPPRDRRAMHAEDLSDFVHLERVHVVKSEDRAVLRWKCGHDVREQLSQVRAVARAREGVFRTRRDARGAFGERVIRDHSVGDDLAPTLTLHRDRLAQRGDPQPCGERTASSIFGDPRTALGRADEELGAEALDDLVARGTIRRDPQDRARNLGDERALQVLDGATIACGARSREEQLGAADALQLIDGGL